VDKQRQGTADRLAHGGESMPQRRRDVVGPDPHEVVVVGSGFGGLAATRALNRADVHVTLIDRTSHHLFQPLLYQVATGILSEGEITPPTREVLRRQRNASVVLGEVGDIDLDARQVTSRCGDVTTLTRYDTLIVAAGARHSYFGHSEFETFSPGLKTIDDALRLRGQIYGAFEMAEVTQDPEERLAWLTFVVVGGGPTGVEMAGQLIELSRRSLRHNFTNFDPATARVILLEAGPRVLPQFGDRLSSRTARSLRRLGVDIRLNTPVVGVDQEGVDVTPSTGQAQRRIHCRTKVWAAGVNASPVAGLLAQRTDTPQNRAGQLQVRPDCTLVGHPDVFVVGDMMQAGVPGVAQVAIQSGRFAARTVLARIDGAPTEPRFHYRDKGSLATIARFDAVADIGGAKLSGIVAWLVWLFVHLVYLVCFKNRLLVLIHWTISFLGSGRQERTSPFPISTSRDDAKGEEDRHDEPVTRAAHR
jgi:NADH:ubiquinone reductase (H+-translocating)